MDKFMDKFVSVMQCSAVCPDWRWFMQAKERKGKLFVYLFFLLLNNEYINLIILLIKFYKIIYILKLLIIIINYIYKH